MKKEKVRIKKKVKAKAGLSGKAEVRDVFRTGKKRKAGAAAKSGLKAGREKRGFKASAAKPKITRQRQANKRPVYLIPVRIITEEKKNDLKQNFTAAGHKTGLLRRVPDRISNIALWRTFLKIVSVYLLVALNWFGLAAINGSVAYFTDTEISRDNTLKSTNLTFNAYLTSQDFRTQSQGGWGTVAHGDNPGAYRDANFSAAFPHGVTIGTSTGYTAYFASGTHVEKFLPAGGKPAALLKNHVNPIFTEAGVLAGQVLALALNIGFDDFDLDFGLSGKSLADHYANGPLSPCADMTVGEVLAAANLILSGRAGALTPAEVSDCATEINEKFVDGARREVSPAEPIERMITVEKTGALEFRYIIETEQTGGDPDLCEALTAEVGYGGVQAYRGGLLSLAVNPRLYDPKQKEWTILIGLPDGAPPDLSDKICGLKFIVRGWQYDMAMPESGFSDRRELLGSVKSGEWGAIADFYETDGPEQEQENGRTVEELFEELDALGPAFNFSGETDGVPASDGFYPEEEGEESADSAEPKEEAKEAEDAEDGDESEEDDENGVETENGEAEAEEDDTVGNNRDGAPGEDLNHDSKSASEESGDEPETDLLAPPVETPSAPESLPDPEPADKIEPENDASTEA